MHTDAFAQPTKPLVVVTGAGAGLGRSLSVAFGRRGIPVVGFGRSLASLEETLAASQNGMFTPMAVDVSQENEVAEAFRAIRAGGGEVSTLINNAAVYPHVDFLHETGASFMRTISVNLGGVVFCTRAALDTMIVTGRGRIINVGSFADLAPQPASSAYSVSKGAARILTQSIVADLADRFPDIVVSTWMPGILRTKMGRADGIDPDQAAEWGVDLALRDDRTLNGVVFDGDLEVLHGRSMKRKVVDALLRRHVPAPRKLGRTDQPSELR